MTIQEFQYDFDVKWDKVDSLQKRSFNAAQKDWLLNEAQWVYLKTQYGLNNKPRIGFEGIEQRIQDLKNLHIKCPLPQVGIVPTKLDSSLFEVDLSQLLYEHLFITRIKVDITKGLCTKRAGVSITQTDDLNDALIDPHNRPSFKFGDVLGVYGKATDLSTTTQNNRYGAGSLFLYTDGTFEIDNVYIEYIKYPNRLWSGTYDLTTDLLPKNANNDYIYQAGVDSAVTSDLSHHTHSEIVDVAVLLASQIIEDPNLVQLGQQKILINK
jgi:hypothetical protein